jgi:hypothetical protein
MIFEKLIDIFERLSFHFWDAEKSEYKGTNGKPSEYKANFGT